MARCGSSIRPISSMAWSIAAADLVGDVGLTAVAGDLVEAGPPRVGQVGHVRPLVLDLLAELLEHDVGVEGAFDGVVDGFGGHPASLAGDGVVRASGCADGPAAKPAAVGRRIDRLARVAAKQGGQLAPGAIVPGSRVDLDGLGPDAVRDRPLAGGLELADSVEDGAVQRWQFLGGRVRLHRASEDDARQPHQRNSPAVPFCEAFRVMGQSP